MKDLNSTVNEFIKLVHQLKFREAHRYYSEDVINIENEGEPVIGLPAKTIKEEELLADFTDISVVPKNTIVCNDMSVTEWHYMFTNKKTGEKIDYTQLSLQRWKNGKIIHERHHYKTR
ncbi:MAG: nuclear transport factor 2 family protein [Chitinophagaceae bacterium]